MKTTRTILMAGTMVALVLTMLGSNLTTAQAAGEVGTKAPSLISGKWSVGKPTTLESLRGKVVVLSFWTTLCINCRRTVPFWSGWAKQSVGTSDLAVVTVHTPETTSEHSVRLSHDYATKHGLNVPVLVDNDRKNWDAYGIEAWPTTLVIDKKGVIRGRWEGELNYDNAGTYHEVDALLAKLRKESAR